MAQIVLQCQLHRLRELMIFAVARRAELRQIQNPVVRLVPVDVVYLEPSVGRTAQQALLVPLQYQLLQGQKLSIVRIRLPSRSPVLVVASLAAELRTIRACDRLLTVQALALHLAVRHRVVDLVQVVAWATAEHPHFLAVSILGLLVLRCAAREALATAVAFERYGRLRPRFRIARSACCSVWRLFASAGRTNAGVPLRWCSFRCWRCRYGGRL